MTKSQIMTYIYKLKVIFLVIKAIIWTITFSRVYITNYINGLRSYNISLYPSFLFAFLLKQSITNHFKQLSYSSEQEANYFKQFLHVLWFWFHFQQQRDGL